MRKEVLTATVWDLVVAVAEAAPEQVLFGDRHGRRLTAAALRDEAERSAAGLRFGPESRVSWQLPNCLEAVVLMFALARVGAVQNPVIPILRERELSLITQEVGSDTLVIPETWNGYGFGDMARSVAARRGIDVVSLDLGGTPGEGMRLPAGDPAGLAPPPSLAGLARWVYFTSGTTGVPKGAQHSDASLIASSWSMTERLGIAPGDVYPIGWPFTHIGGASIAMAVLRGRGLIVLFDSFDQTTFGDDVAEVGPTILGSGIPFFRAYLDAQRRHREDGPLYPTLRALTAGGAPTPPELIQELTSTFGVKGVGNAWGLTEFPIACCADAEVDPPEKLAVSVGRPSPGVEVRVVDGELRLKGPQCFLGYMDPTLDGSVFDEEGWLRTGDAGEVDSDGFVTITGRIKDVIIRNGENISPLEIEDVLLRHPDVQDVAVIGIPDQRTGERVVAIIVPHPGATIDLVMVRDHFTSEGVARQKTPEQVELTAEIARNPMGKAKKDEMRRALLSTGSARADLN